MTQWGLDTLFNPAKRHMDEEKQRLQSTREEVGDASGGRRIDLDSGKVRISKPAAAHAGPAAAPAGSAEESAGSAEESTDEAGLATSSEYIATSEDIATSADADSAEK